MEFLKFVRSLEELLYEVMTWLLFYPRTFWRALVHPLALAARAEAEMQGQEEDQFIDLVSPPLFLMLTLLLTHGLEVALHEQIGNFADSLFAKRLITSDTNLLIFRIIVGSFFPIVMAHGMLRRQKRTIDRASLRAPFFLQCFFSAPFLVAMAVATSFGRFGMVWPATLFYLGGIGWYLGVQTTWFASRLGMGRMKAFGVALGLFSIALVIVFAITVLVFGLKAG
jgi:hypothetical protein